MIGLFLFDADREGGLLLSGSAPMHAIVRIYNIIVRLHPLTLLRMCACGFLPGVPIFSLRVYISLYPSYTSSYLQRPCGKRAHSGTPAGLDRSAALEGPQGP
jgi:hypothetical protein